MAINEESRHELYTRLEEVLGPEQAATLMEHLPPVGWADVATKRDLDALATAMRGEMGELRGELRGEMGELRGEMGELRGEMGEVRGEMRELRGEVRELRGEMTELRGSFELRLADWSRTMIYANLGAVVATAALAFAAAHL